MTQIRTSLAALLVTFIGLTASAAPSASAVPAPMASTASTASTRAAPVAVIIGPAASAVRPGPSPVDVRTLTLPKAVEREWLQKDADMIWHIRSVLPPDPSAPVFLRALQGVGREEIDLGFGYERHTARLGAGYSSCGLSAVSHDGALLTLRIECQTSADKDAAAAVLPIIDQALGGAFVPVREPFASHLVRVAYDFPAANAAAEQSLARALGPLETVDGAALAPALRQAYALLMSPLDDLALGTSCGFAGVTPPGREAATTLQTANRVDLFRNVLRGPNPAGRIYAARALAAMKAMRADDEAVVKTIAALPIVIDSCSGCIFRHVSSKEALESKESQRAMGDHHGALQRFPP